MEQKQINAIIIAGIVVIGAGAWAGPIMQADTLKVFLIDLNNIQSAQVGFYDDQGWNEWDEFGIGDYKDEIFFFDHDDSFAEAAFFGGPVIPLQAFSQELIPSDTTGISVITSTTASDFGLPVTFIEMDTCDGGDSNITGGLSRLLDECQPAILDKIFIQTPVASEDTDVFRVQVAVCSDDDMLLHVNAVTNPDTNVTNDTCSSADQGAFDKAVIILDVIVQNQPDGSMHGFFVEGGAIPAFKGSALMVRAADNDASNNTVKVWVGVIRTGDEGAFNFVNPIEFGGVVPDSCAVITITKTAVAQENVEIELFFGDLAYFAVTGSDGKAEFDHIPDDVFAAIDIFIDLDGDGREEVLFIDRFFDVSNPPTTTNTAGDTCVDVTFETDNRPQF